LKSSLNVEAVLYNENTLAWEPLIEPIYIPKISPWDLTCSIASKLVLIETDHLLNLTITKTGIKLLTNLFSSFTNFDHEHQLTLNTKKNKSMLELVNRTGQSLFLTDLQGLLFTDNQTWSSIVFESNQSIALTPIVPRSAYRLSVIEQQTSFNQQQFTLQVHHTLSSPFPLRFLLQIDVD